MTPPASARIALARSQALAGQVERRERRRAGRVDRDARSLEAEGERDAARRGVQRASGGGIEIGVFGTLVDDLGAVVARSDAHEDARRAAGEAVRGDRRALERFPRRFEEEALLRVHRRGLAGRDAEELRLEAIHLREEAAPLARHLAYRRGIRIVVLFMVPAVPRDLGDGVDAIAKQAPEALQVFDLSREPAARAHDGEGRVRSLLDVSEPAFEPLDRRQGFAEQVPLRGHGRADPECSSNRVVTRSLRRLPRLEGTPPQRRSTFMQWLP